MKTRDIQLHDNLKRLIASNLKRLIASRGAGARAALCTEIGISHSALSQYERQKALPTLENLVKIAKYFDKSTDYLLFGEDERADIDQMPIDPMYQRIDNQLFSVRSRIESRSWLSFRIAAELSQKIGAEAEKILARPEGKMYFIPGFLDDTTVMTIEKYSKFTRLISSSSVHDIEIRGNEVHPGKFFHIVINNILKGYTYKFLIPRNQTWNDDVHKFINMLQDRANEPLHRRASFARSSDPVVCGMGIYELDIENIQLDHPIIYKQIEEFITSDGLLAYIIPPSTSAHGDTLVDREKAAELKIIFDDMWAKAQLV